MQGNLAGIFYTQSEQAKIDRLMFSAGILQAANDNFFDRRSCK